MSSAIYKKTLSSLCILSGEIGGGMGLSQMHFKERLRQTVIMVNHHNDENGMYKFN